MSKPEANDLEGLPGLGPKSAAWLREVGIDSPELLREHGAATVYLRIERLGVRPGRNLLWALHGAIHGKSWLEVTDDEKRRLKVQLARLAR